MSLIMRKLILGLVCLACVGDCWQLRSPLIIRCSQPSDSQKLVKTAHPLQAVALFLLAFNPAASFSAYGSQGMLSCEGKVRPRSRQCAPAIMQQSVVLEATPTETNQMSVEEAGPLLLKFLRDNGIAQSLLQDETVQTLEARELVARVAFLRALHGPDSGWPRWSEQSLIADAEEWLAPALQQARSLQDLQSSDVAGLLSAKLNDKQLATLELQAPPNVVLPSGTTANLIYSLDTVLPQSDADCEGLAPVKPVLQADMQEFFGFTAGPSVGGPPGKTLEVQLNLLSPTGDSLATASNGLFEFWKGGYHEIREEAQSKYPLKPWPEDPIAYSGRGRGQARGGSRRPYPGWAMKVSKLPIVPLLPGIVEALRQSDNLVLQAPPGAGKTTAVPLALMDEQFGVILMLQPRRVAARSAASRMSALLDEQLGGTVGYRIRLEGSSSSRTKVLVVTEGILLRRLQFNPELTGVDLVIFDEFHERSIDADLSLALCRRAQLLAAKSGGRGPKILVMSATLGDTSRLQELLGGCDLITSDGACFPVTVKHMGGASFWTLAAMRPNDIGQRVGEVVLQALSEASGDVLAFLPGESEIRNTEAVINSGLDKNVRLGIKMIQLFGALDQAIQRKAIEPDPEGKRRVILATPIAESSLTIENVRIIVDSGLRKIAAFDHVTGISTLKTVPISLASAVQRAGRAGRVASGVAYRLWSKDEEKRLDPDTSPEIEYGELSQLALDLAGLNFSTRELIDTLPWPSRPPQNTLTTAHNLLLAIGALRQKFENGMDAGLESTQYAKRLVRLPLNPRLSHMLLSTVGDEQLEKDATHLAAMLSDRYLMRRGQNNACADVRMRLNIIKSSKPHPNTNVESWMRAKQEAAELQKELRGTQGGDDDLRDFFAESRKLGEDGNQTVSDNPELTRAIANIPAKFQVGALLALAYPDRVGQAKFGRKNTFTMANGVIVVMPDNTDPDLADSEFVVAAAIESGSKRPGAPVRLHLAAPIDLDALRVVHSPSIEEKIEAFVVANDPNGTVQARRLLKFGTLWLDPEPLATPSVAQCRPILVQELKKRGLGQTLFQQQHPQGGPARELLAKVGLLRKLHGASSGWPAWSEETLNRDAETWLDPALQGATSLTDLRTSDLHGMLSAQLTPEQLERLEQQAPSIVELPSGTRAKIIYSKEYGPGMPQRATECDGGKIHKPVLEVEMHEFFGFTAGPLVGGPPGQTLEVQLDLLSPGGDLLAMVSDGLNNFWQGPYHKIRKEHQVKFPMFNWPDDPATYSLWGRGGPGRGKGRGMAA